MLLFVVFFPCTGELRHVNIRLETTWQQHEGDVIYRGTFPDTRKRPKALTQNMMLKPKRKYLTQQLTSAPL